MDVQLKLATLDEKQTLLNLLEKYNYEFSQYDKRPFDEQGAFGYKYLDCYWQEDNRYPYLIKVDGKLAGFALINKIKECDCNCDWSVAEFFVGYLYRRKGVATQIMEEIFRRHKGFWHIKYHCNNIASEKFWNKLVSSVTNNNYKILQSSPFYDGTVGKVLYFKI